MNFKAERLGYHYVSRQRRRHDRALHTQLPASKRGKIDKKTGKRIPRKAPKTKPKPMYSEKTHKRMWRRSLRTPKKIGGSKFRTMSVINPRMDLYTVHRMVMHC